MAKRKTKVRKFPHPPMNELVKLTSAVRKLHRRLHREDSRISLMEVRYSLAYLKLFGHLNGTKVGEISADQFIKALKRMQRFLGLAPTGQLDPVVSGAMIAPRCGVPDVDPLRLQLKLSDGAPLPLVQQRWKKPKLTWFMDSFVAGIPEDVQQDIVAKAYKSWSDVCGLKIDKATSADSCDILVSTGRGPRNQFDGPSGTLAWAYLPVGNDSQLLLLLDLDENWAAETAGSPREILMENVVCHEAGHTLGLDHSKVPNALMAPYYSVSAFKPINPDDISRVVKLYGKP